MREIHIDERDFATSDELHAHLARVLSFPDYYGMNLSALADCLGDIDRPTRLVIRRTPKPFAAVSDDTPGWFDRACVVISRESQANPCLDAIVYVDDTAGETDDAPTDVTAEEALRRLARGNRRFLEAHRSHGDVSDELVRRLFEEGQRPYAVVITCSDSRVVPEHIFMCGLGELFVIRTAGNVVDAAALGSALYAVDHLNVSLVLVLGHTHCGAVEAAIAQAQADLAAHEDPLGIAEADDCGHDGQAHHHGHAPTAVRALADRIAQGIGDETDPYAASVLNVRAGIETLMTDPDLADLVSTGRLFVRGGVYHTATGVVDFLADQGGYDE